MRLRWIAALALGAAAVALLALAWRLAPRGAAMAWLCVAADALALAAVVLPALRRPRPRSWVGLALFFLGAAFAALHLLWPGAPGAEFRAAGFHVLYFLGAVLWGGPAAALYAALAYPVHDQAFGLLALGDFTPILLYAVLAVGLNFVVGQAGLLHLGYAAFFAIGAYSSGILTSPNFPFQLPMLVSVPAAAAICALSGLLLASPVLRLRGDYLAIVTLGFGEILQVALINVVPVTNGKSGISPVGLPRWRGEALDAGGHPFFWFYLAAGLLLAALLVSRNLERSRLGRAWNAIREDELAADCMGVSPVGAKLQAFVVSAVIAGVAGAFYASYVGALYPDDYTFFISVMVLSMVILGGMGNRYGVVLGAVLITYFDRMLAPRLTQWAQHTFFAGGGGGAWRDFVNMVNYRYLLFGLALILMMRWRPEGILPAAATREEQHEGREEA